MIEKIKRIVWYIKNMRPYKVFNFLTHIHKFGGYDTVIIGYKYAILYGKLYFLKNKYSNGILDKDYRRNAIDKIICEFKNPQDRLKYIALLRETKKDVIRANEMGLISTPNPQIITVENGKIVSKEDKRAKKEEADSYQMAIDSLDIAMIGSAIYPQMWKHIFVQQP